EVLDAHPLGHVVQLGHRHRLQLADVDGPGGGLGRQHGSGFFLAWLRRFGEELKPFGRLRRENFLGRRRSRLLVLWQALYEFTLSGLPFRSGGLLGNSWHKRLAVTRSHPADSVPVGIADIPSWALRRLI